MSAALKKMIDRIDNAAALPDDTPEQRLAKTLLIFISAAAILVIPWGGWYLASIGMTQAAIIIAFYSVISALAVLDLLLRKSDSICRPLQLLALLLVPTFIQWNMGSFADSGAIVLWAFLAPMCALVFHGPRLAVYWYAMFAIFVILLGAVEVAHGSSQDGTLLFVESILLVTCVVFIAMRFFSIEREKARAALEEEHRLLVREQERSEQLLLNILPASIAERLKTKQQTIADGFENVSILFADLVGFTRLSARIGPTELVVMLNKLFSEFDRLAEHYHVEKIKTIGDAYMVCAGLPAARPDHAEVIAEMALSMRDVVAAYNRDNDTDLSIRIGINSGPVVAGVIGLKKFIYDLWGDTVNVASRMESHGLPDRIHITESTMRLLKDKYNCEPREPMEVKGVGRIQTWFLNR